MTNLQMAKCFNEWMRRFIEEPARFEREFVTVNNFLTEQANGVTPSYGDTGAAYMQQIATELAAA